MSQQQLTRGITLVETMGALMLLGIVVALAAPWIVPSESFSDRIHRLASQFDLSRARAMAQTSAYRITAISNNQFVIDKANACHETNWTRDSHFISEDLRLSSQAEIDAGRGVRLSEVKVNGEVASPLTHWSICYSSRGLNQTDLLLTFTELPTKKTIKIQVFAGGALEIYED